MSVVALGTVSEVVSKGTTPTSVGLSFSASGIPFLKGEDVLGTVTVHSPSIPNGNLVNL